MNSKILISIVIVAAIGVAAAGYQISSTNNLFTLTDSQTQDSSQDSSSSASSTESGTGSSSGSGSESGSSGSYSVKVTSTQAKNLAKESIDYEGAYPGTPTLKSMWGTKVYIVPVMIKEDGKEVRIGEIYIDAITGENLKGAGGG